MAYTGKKGLSAAASLRELIHPLTNANRTTETAQKDVCTEHHLREVDAACKEE
jgi:hypothetical protein